MVPESDLRLLKVEFDAFKATVKAVLGAWVQADLISDEYAQDMLRDMGYPPATRNYAVEVRASQKIMIYVTAETQDAAVELVRDMKEVVSYSNPDDWNITPTGYVSCED